MQYMTKSLLGAGAAAAVLVGVAAPAYAQDRHDRHRDRVSAGDIIVGAVVLGGLAAIFSSGKNSRDDNRAGYRGSGREAVNQCVANVERWANGYNRSDVTQIRDVQPTRYGYRVRGHVVGQDGGRGYNAYGNNRYDRDDPNASGRGYGKGRFICTVEQGRVVDIDYRSFDQWR
jgi:hypothetical protein